MINLKKRKIQGIVLSESKPLFSAFKRKNHRTGRRDKTYTYRFLDHQGKWKTIKTKFTKKDEANREAKFKAQDAHEMRIGLKANPMAGDHVDSQTLDIHLSDYINWGEAHGGKFRKPWDSEHVRKIQSQMKWWLNKTNWCHYQDINLRQAEKVLISKSLETKKTLKDGVLVDVKITGKTVNHYKNTLISFVNYIIKEFQLKTDHPLSGLTGWDTSVTYKTRDLTLKEIGRLLKQSPTHRSIIYHVAVLTGLRREELSQLTDANFDKDKSYFTLNSDHNKERLENVIIHIPQHLCEQLIKYQTDRGTHNRLFKFNFNQAVAFFDEDCLLAKIKKVTSHGKLVFHSLRKAHVNLIIDHGADVKTGMSLSRHKTSSIYLTGYATRKEGKILDVTQRLDDSIKKEVQNTPKNQVRLQVRKDIDYTNDKPTKKDIS